MAPGPRGTGGTVWATRDWIATPMLDTPLGRTLHPNVRWVWVAAWGVGALVLTALSAGAVAIISLATDSPAAWWVPAVVALLGLVWSGVWPTLAWRRWRWDVDDLALTLHKGVITRQVRALPFFRIQHIDTTQGPLDRALGLTALIVHTASITSRLPGIDDDEAQALRTDLLERAATAAREATTDGDVDAV